MVSSRYVGFARIVTIIENMKTFIEEFKEFAVKGNVIDLAVAVIIGGAFGKIVSSLVDTILMPGIGFFLGGIDFTGWVLHVGEVSIAYGEFIQAVVDFTIIALVVFIAVRIMHRFKRRREVEEKNEPKLSEEVLLLREIRDLLRR